MLRYSSSPAANRLLTNAETVRLLQGDIDAAVHPRRAGSSHDNNAYSPSTHVSLGAPPSPTLIGSRSPSMSTSSASSSNSNSQRGSVTSSAVSTPSSSPAIAPDCPGLHLNGSMRALSLPNTTAPLGHSAPLNGRSILSRSSDPWQLQHGSLQQFLAGFQVLAEAARSTQASNGSNSEQSQSRSLEGVGAASEDATHELPPKDPRLSAIKAHSVGFVRALRSKHSSVLCRFKARMNHLKDLYRQLDKDKFTLSDVHTILFDHRITVDNGYRSAFCKEYQTLMDQCIYDLRYEFVDALFYHQVLSYEYQKQRLKAEDAVEFARSTASTSPTAMPSGSMPSAEDRCDFLWRSSMLMLENGSADDDLAVQEYNDHVEKWTSMAYQYHGQHDEDKWKVVDRDLRLYAHPKDDTERVYNRVFQSFKTVVASMLLSIERYRLSVPGLDHLILRLADRVQAAVVYHYPKTMDIKKSAIERSLNSFKMDIRHLLDEEINHPTNTFKNDCIASTRWMIKCILPLIFAIIVTIIFYKIGWHPAA